MARRSYCSFVQASRSRQHWTYMWTPVPPNIREKHKKVHCLHFLHFVERNPTAMHIAFARSRNALLDSSWLRPWKAICVALFRAYLEEVVSACASSAPKQTQHEPNGSSKIYDLELPVQRSRSLWFLLGKRKKARSATRKFPKMGAKLKVRRCQILCALLGKRHGRSGRRQTPPPGWPPDGPTPFNTRLVSTPGGAR